MRKKCTFFFELFIEDIRGCARKIRGSRRKEYRDWIIREKTSIQKSPNPMIFTMRLRISLRSMASIVNR